MPVADVPVAVIPVILVPVVVVLPMAEAEAVGAQAASVAAPAKDDEAAAKLNRAECRGDAAAEPTSVKLLLMWWAVVEAV